MSKLIHCDFALLLMNLSLCGVLAFVCAGCCTSLTPPHSESIITPEGVELRVSVPASCQAGKPVNMLVTLTNKGSLTVSYGETDGIRELGIRVVDSANVSPEKTRKGKGSIAPPFWMGEGAGDTKLITHKLRPGGSAEWSVDLNSLYYLPPKKYFVSVLMELSLPRRDGAPPKMFLVPVDWVEFTIH